MIDSVIIEPIRKDDDRGYFKLVNGERERLATYFPQTTARCSDVAATRKYIKEMIARAKAGEFMCFVLRDYEGGDPIGAVFLKQFDPGVRKCEVAYFVSSTYEGHGVGSLALIWAIDHAFNVLNMNKVYARMVPENIGSIRVCEKCGFAREGLLRHDFRTTDGRLLDVYLYGRLKEEG